MSAATGAFPTKAIHDVIERMLQSCVSMGGSVSDAFVLVKKDEIELLETLCARLAEAEMKSGAQR